jgi:PAS domain S-box-containing protein
MGARSLVSCIHMRPPVGHASRTVAIALPAAAELAFPRSRPTNPKGQKGHRPSPFQRVKMIVHFAGYSQRSHCDMPFPATPICEPAMERSMSTEEGIGGDGAPRGGEQELRLLVETIPTLVWRAGPGGDFEYVNKRVLEYVGAPLAEIIGWGWMEKIHPDDIAFKVSTWLKNLESGDHHDAVCRIRGADGRYRWFDVRGEPLRARDGTILSWYGVLIDIDDRRKAEEALRESEYKLRQIIETMPSFHWSTGPDGEPTQVNQRVLDYSGMRFEDFLHLGWKEFLHPDDFSETADAFSHAIETGTSFHAVHRLRRADGEYRWYQARGEPLRDQQGRIIQWFGLSIDIDEGKRAEDQLRSTQTRLARASQIATVAELSASIAHEINQPLAAIVANAQTCQAWLSGDNPNVARARVAVDRIVRDATAAAEVVRRIRALFTHATPDKSQLQMNEVIQEVWQLLQSEMSRRGVLGEFDLAQQPPPIAVDRIQIQQVLVNLIRNAAEAMEASDGLKQLIVRSRHVDGRIVVEVCDSGPGLADKERAFEAFYSTKQNGMGVGLSISRSIIQAHEGELWARDNAPRGTIFTLTLPAPRSR